LSKPLREDNRKPLLVYLDPDLILKLKRRALEEDRHTYLLVEELLKKSLERPFVRE
jgi:hypothetical protein